MDNKFGYNPDDPNIKSNEELHVHTEVKKTYRPDWLDSENKIFINKLNFICENYDKTH